MKNTNSNLRAVGSSRFVRLRWRAAAVAGKPFGHAHLVRDGEHIAVCGFSPCYYWQGDSPFVSTDKGPVRTRRLKCTECQANDQGQAIRPE